MCVCVCVCVCMPGDTIYDGLEWRITSEDTLFILIISILDLDTEHHQPHTVIMFMNMLKCFTKCLIFINDMIRALPVWP